MNGSIYLFSRFFQSPLEALFILLIFIMAKELEATPLQLSVMVAAKPTVSLIAYLTSLVFAAKDHLKKTFLLTSSALSTASCLLLPFIENNWFYIFSYALFMISIRSSTPIWIECLKDSKKFTYLLATGSSLNYAILVIMTLLAAFLIDQNASIWKDLFFAGGLFQLFNLISLYFLKLNPSLSENCENALNIQTSYKILVNNRPFFNFQILFFLGGIGLVSIQPIIPIYFSEKLNFSYKEFALALSICRGIAFVFTSHAWVNLLNQTTLYYICMLLDLLAALFVVFLLLGTLNAYFIYVGYLIYGALQSGCELAWNYSGAHFSKNNESLSLTGINHLFIGVRGVISPFAGHLIFNTFNFSGVFLFSALLSVISTYFAYHLHKNYHQRLSLKELQ